MTDDVEVPVDTEPAAGGQAPAPGYSPWPDLRVIGALLLVALVCLVGSFILPGPSTKVVRTTRVAPISTTAGQVQTVHLPQSHFNNASYDVDLQFHFNLAALKTAETIFYVGSPKYGVSAWVSQPIQGNRYVVLSGTDFSAVLVNHVVVGQSYSVGISIGQGGSSITASVDGHQQFSFSDLPADLLRYLKVVTVGGPLPPFPDQLSPHTSTHAVVKQSPLLGAVSGFTLSSQALVPSGSATHVSALRVLAGLAVSLAVVLLILRIVTSGVVAEWLGISARRKREAPLWWAWVREHGALVGVVLLVTGVATLALVTPLDNMVVQQSGVQNSAASDVGPNQKTNYALFGEPALFASAASLDVHLTFQMRLDGPASVGSAKFPVVSTFGNGQGLAFMMEPSRKGPYLTGTVGSKGWLAPGTTYNLLYRFPIHQWVTTTVDVHRNQSFIYMVDGKQVQTLTLNLPVLDATPTKLNVDGAFGGSIRHVDMTVTLFAQQPGRVPYLLIRLAQALGILAIVSAVLLLAQRFLSGLIPPALRIRRGLALTTFWTMGIATAINILVDLPKFQRAGSLYLERNTWLNTQYSRFGDFFVPFELLHSLNPYNIQNGSYPPIGYWLLAPVIWLNEYAALFVTLALVFGFLVWWLWRSFTCGMPVHQRILVVAVALLSLPITFGDRGNIDLIIFVIVVVGIAAFEQQKNLKAALWIGLAGAAKITPILYLLLFLRGRKLKYLVIGVAFAGFLTALGFSGFRSGLIGSLGEFKAGLSSLQVQNHNAKGSTPFNASILGWLQSLGYAAKGLNGAQAVNNALERFVVPAEILGALVLAWYIRWRESSLWRSVTLITGLFILLNQVSYYYELIFLFVPLSLFVKDATVNRRGIVIGVLFGIVLAPRAYFYLANSRVDSSVLTTAPLLIALLVAVVYDGYRERKGLDDSTGSADESREAEPSLPTSA